MPVINIREIDNITPGVSSLDDYVVFVPGNANKSDFSDFDKPLLFTSLKDFEETIGTTPVEYTIDVNYDTTPYVVDGKVVDPGYLSAKLLLEKGLYVLYKVPATLTRGANPEVISNDVVTDNEIDVEGATAIQTIITLANGGDPDATASGGVYTYDEVTFIEDIDGVTYETINGTSYASAIFKNADGTSQVAFESVTAEDVATYISTGSFTYNSQEMTKLYATVTTYVERYTTTKSAINTYGNFVAAITKSSFYLDLDDRGLYNLSFVTNGGYETLSNDMSTPVPASIQAIKTLAETRGDCVALIDHKWNASKAELLPIAQRVVTKYGAMFTPWCKYAIDTYNVTLPASIAYLDAFGTGIKDNPLWYAMAGSQRGYISGTPIANYGEAFANTLSRDIGVSINPITTINPYGIIIWGNRTLYGNPTGLKASSFLSIRHLCDQIKKQLYISAKGSMFEQNTDRLWFNFKSQLVTLLDNVQSGEGIEAYKIFKLTPDTKAQIKALIRIVPTYPVEKFDLTLELSDTLVDITE